MVSGGDESSRMMETELDCFTPSTRIAAPSLQELCSTICASLSSFSEPMLKTLLLVICFVCKQSWKILEDHHNFIIARTCTKTDVACVNHRRHTAIPTSFYLEPFMQSHRTLRAHIY